MSTGTEFADVIDNDPESITCVCGNTCADEGMIQSNSDGIAYHLMLGAVPEGLAEMPDDVNEMFMVCPSCGRVYHDQTIRDTGKAPVLKTVDTKSGPVEHALKLHWELGE
ncbi:MAG TPA: hypothetical protein VF885_16995 [Arthrobacter sp.]